MRNDIHHPELMRSTLAWFVAAGQMPPTPEPSVRTTALYLGLQLEELAEKLELILGDAHSWLRQMRSLSAALKSGAWDDRIMEVMADPRKLAEFLDGDMDLIWVSLGAAAATGSDAVGAYAAVAGANWAKFPGGVAVRDANGKVVKPAGWTAADLTPYLHPTLREGA